MNKQERCEARTTKIAAFEESSVAKHDAQIFGLPFSVQESEVVLIPAPWEVTVSFRPGTAKGPEAIRQASHQVDLYNPETPDAWKYGFAMEHERLMYAESSRLRAIARDCISHQEKGGSREDPHFLNNRDEVNKACLNLNHHIKQKSILYLREDKIVGIVGGDHSVPLGLMQALAQHHGSYGILHIDAHFDHREAYEGFEFSHASIMRNASQIPEIEKFVHVGIRDYCKEEAEFVELSDRFKVFTDQDLALKEFSGHTWHQQCKDIVRSLPRHVYISFDIDGLDPTLCPNTGTPVAGGLGFQRICFLLHHLFYENRKIIGFDLCEVAPKPDCEDVAADWNANVGAHILYRLCSLTATSIFGHWQE